MKKILAITTALLVVLFLLGTATNPSYAEYKEWFKANLYKEANASTELEKSVTGFIADIVSDAGVVRKDYKFYSLYKIETEDFNYKVIGIFDNFYVIKDEEKNQD
ncbi:hypothetical protein J2Z76_000425 [Sedimentibacter acidaminivorans]|uniref:DUF4359 domain-containing protein n=1 Tax=Sedimentibacter acidaminivorans TaxID=913099 RepID=A0ABS4GA66_9FIRM|nr:hypothetical protein [Sedimentibacter acidaminivorans]MBP1924572.1 hypothetical protein [Sedimentibacter acidaminivorans]